MRAADEVQGARHPRLVATNDIHAPNEAIIPTHDGLTRLRRRTTDARIQRFFLAGKHPKQEDVERAVEWWFGDRAEELAGPSARVLQNDLEQLGAATSTRGSALAVLADVYESRRAEDRARLERMLAFAEEKGCRTQSIREYFGEKPGGLCERCDYCEDRGKRVVRRRG